jgi:hypothetical protein
MSDRELIFVYMALTILVFEALGNRIKEYDKDKTLGDLVWIIWYIPVIIALAIMWVIRLP